MKKYLFATLMAVMGVCAQAQIVSSSSSRVIHFVDEKPAEPFKPTRYVKGGFSVLNFISENDDWMSPSYYSLTGYNLVFGYDKPFFQDKTDAPLRGCISWGIEAGLSSRGTGIDLSGDYELSGDDCVEVLKHSLIVNPKLTFKIGSPKFSWYYDLGAFVRFDYATGIDAGYDDLETLFQEWTEDQNVDAGLSLGTGFWINRFEIGFGVLFGFSPLFSTGTENEIEGMTISPQFHIGWAF